jgi:hypothetical protein
MRVVALWLIPALVAWAADSHAGAPEVYAQLTSLAGEWQAELPGFGTLTNTIRVVSNGKAIEETIGTPADNELSVYTLDDERILLTHYCAMTPDGHQVRLLTARLGAAPERLDFIFAGATNLRSADAPHMRRMSMTFGDRDHFSETWTKIERGKATVFELKFVRH